jgi:hypothetical protein
MSLVLYGTFMIGLNSTKRASKTTTGSCTTQLLFAFLQWMKITGSIGLFSQNPHQKWNNNWLEDRSEGQVFKHLVHHQRSGFFVLLSTLYRTCYDYKLCWLQIKTIKLLSGKTFDPIFLLVSDMFGCQLDPMTCFLIKQS